MPQHKYLERWVGRIDSSNVYPVVRVAKAHFIDDGKRIRVRRKHDGAKVALSVVGDWFYKSNQSQVERLHETKESCLRQLVRIAESKVNECKRKLDYAKREFEKIRDVFHDSQHRPCDNPWCPRCYGQCNGNSGC